MAAHHPFFDAIILAGGQGSRLGGTDKAALDLAGAPLIQRSVDAAAAAQRLVVVGQTQAPLPTSALNVVEDPPGGGPAAAVLAGLSALATMETPRAAPWVLVLACDTPGAPDGVELLMRELLFGGVLLNNIARAEGSDGAVLVDPDGRAQWTMGMYSRAALEVSAARLGHGTGLSMRALCGSLKLATVAGHEQEYRDVDTWDDHRWWRNRLLANPRASKE